MSAPLIEPATMVLTYCHSKLRLECMTALGRDSVPLVYIRRKSWSSSIRGFGAAAVVVNHCAKSFQPSGGACPAGISATLLVTTPSSRVACSAVDVNSASAEQREKVFQTDGERARYLIDARNRLGAFKSWEEIKSEVPSFDDGMIENMKQAGARVLAVEAGKTILLDETATIALADRYGITITAVASGK